MGYDRFLALVGKEESGGALVMPERVSVKFPTEGAAAAFYGFSERGWQKLKAIARDLSDPLPVDTPAAMPGWFDRARSAGRRKHRTPESIMARAREGVVAKALAPQKAKPLPEEPPQPDLALEMAGEAGNEDIVQRYRRASAALGAQWDRQIAAGQTFEARQTMAEQMVVDENIRQWEQSLKKIREGNDYLHRDTVIAGAGAFCVALWRLLTRELIASFPPAEEPRVRNMLARLEERMPQLLPAEFQLQEAPV